MYSKRNLIYAGVGIVLFLAIIGVALMIRNYQTQIKKGEEVITSLQGELDRIGEMGYVYQLNTDVKSKNIIQGYEMELVEMPMSVIPPNAVTDEAEVAGKYYKIGLGKQTTLTLDMVMDFAISDDMREMDVVFDEIPIGLMPGDYIDVRISFPLGQDYIAMSHKRVVAINDSTAKLIVSQEDFYTYEAMKTDLAIYASTKIYGAKYVEAGVQKEATVYYPVSLEVLHTKLLDPNIDTSDYSMILERRQQLEEQLLASDKVDISNTVTSGKENIGDKFSEAKKDYDKLQEKKAAELLAAQALEQSKVEEAE